MNLTTYNDRKERQIGITANHTSHADKVLFFAHPHFLFFNFTADAHLAHCLLPAYTQARQKGKSQRAIFFPVLYSTII